jgi:hypothetical protein
MKMGIFEMGIEVAKMLIPPKTNELEEQQRWRWVVFAALIGLSTTLALHIALACGWMPAIWPGFALASDTQAIQRRVDVIATLAIEHEIRIKATELCSEKDQMRRNEINDDIAKLQREYHDIASNWYNIPPCAQL